MHHPAGNARDSSPPWRFGALCAVLLLGLAGCAGPAGVKRVDPAAGGPGSALPGPAKALPPSPLAAESTWLKSLFEATPVQIVDEADGAVLLSVPLNYAFEGAGAVAKPPVKAVLDKLAMSLRRQLAARLQLASPGPGADQRVLAMRRQLTAAGIGGWRLATLASSREDAVQLRLVPGATARRQLEDAPAAAPPGPR